MRRSGPDPSPSAFRGECGDDPDPLSESYNACRTVPSVGTTASRVLGSDHEVPAPVWSGAGVHPLWETRLSPDQLSRMPPGSTVTRLPPHRSHAEGSLLHLRTVVHRPVGLFRPSMGGDQGCVPGRGAPPHTRWLSSGVERRNHLTLAAVLTSKVAPILGEWK